MSKTIAITQLFELVRSAPKTVTADVIKRVDDEIALLGTREGNIPREGLDYMSLIKAVSSEVQCGNYRSAQMHCQEAEEGFDIYLKKHLKEYYERSTVPPRDPPFDYDEEPKGIDIAAGSDARAKTQQNTKLESAESRPGDLMTEDRQTMISITSNQEGRNEQQNYAQHTGQSDHRTERPKVSNDLDKLMQNISENRNDVLGGSCYEQEIVIKQKELEQQKRKLQDTCQNLRDVTTTLEAEKREKEVAAKRHDAIVQQLLDKIETLQLKLDSTQTENTKCRRKLYSLESEKQHAVNSYKKEVDAKQKELEQQKRELNHTCQKLRDVSATLEAEKLNKGSMTEQREVITLQFLERIKSLQKKVDSLLKENKEYRQNIESQKTEKQVLITRDRTLPFEGLYPADIAEEFTVLFDSELADVFEVLKLEDEKENANYSLNILKNVYQLCHDSSQRQLNSIRDSFATVTLCVGKSCVEKEDIPSQVAYDAVPGRKKETGSNAIPGRKHQDTLQEPTVDAVPGRRRDETVEDSGVYRTLTTEVDQIFREQRRALLTLRTFVMDKHSADIEKVGTEIIAKSLPDNLQMNETMLRFIQKCLRVCWKMCQTEPPLHIDFPDTTQDLPFDSQRFKTYTMSGSRVHFVVWPALYLHRGGSLLSKGVAEGH